ncbi:2-amino-4-hydroxy-6-hydroxymethyldihydropteridine diphosphokinase [Sphingosinicella humi]|uniref:2-amino-4-hydroxy-6-hydroxymethyldihydropteridine pyrophosphokinase n=1 Tax=Allosphingosinicella humi TaxID=2068657 RepID=A0A2U2J4N7_9SPHN|nr:2-amino-4-hydroxy-6-hydroxymethyldihydropteridine diphosphokinase [Sphingosinicella humi]PWG03313.1 2-amino-4-hydroxy-6-hydroxymethyldihydropteridine diphosphokinase [Sphingosinicella humi]
MVLTSYAIALGSNRRSRHGAPADTVRAAAETLGVQLLSSIRATPALGPAGRGFANAAAIVATDLEPSDLLAELKSIERAFGRRGGRRWGPRVLDLDIVLWSGGPYEGEGLVIPHPSFRDRLFVLEPLSEIAADWRDPVTGATVRQLLHRLRRRNPVDPRPGGT